MDWSQVLATALPTIALVGGTLLKTHATVKRVLVAVEQILSVATSDKQQGR